MTDIAAIHPGGHLAETLGELGISRRRLAKGIDVSPQSTNEIVRCRHAVTADMALRIGRALGTTAESRLALQRLYDPDCDRATIDVSRINPLVITGGGWNSNEGVMHAVFDAGAASAKRVSSDAFMPLPNPPPPCRIRRFCPRHWRVTQPPPASRGRARYLDVTPFDGHLSAALAGGFARCDTQPHPL